MPPLIESRVSRPRRIAIVGSPGSGKSFLARRLGLRWGIPVTHLDDLYWYPDWIRTDVTTWQATIQRIAAEPTWIIDGNFADTLEPRIARAELVIFLDFPTLQCLVSVMIRHISRVRGNRTSLPRRIREAPGTRAVPLFRFGFWWFVTRFRSVVRPSMLALFERVGANVLILRSRQEVAAFLARLDADQSSSI